MGRAPALLIALLKSKRSFALVHAIFAVFLLAVPQAVAQTRGPTSVADTAEKLQDTVVNISTSQKLKGAREVPMPEVPKGSPFEEFFQDFYDKDGSERANSLGSGFIVDSSGLIVTNNHVIEGADEITVIFTNGTKLKVAKVIGRDPKTDLALLKVETKTPLKAAKFGNSQKMRVGDWVMAIGNPFGLGGTVTVGVISATRRDINAGLFDEYLQTDAAINRGNSGGPLFNMDGEVIGVNTAIMSPTGGSIGIGFAVPSNTVSQVIEQLKLYGETRRGWLGVRIQTVSEEIAESLGLKNEGGALVANVAPGSPGALAGIEVGDVILKFDGLEIGAMRQLPKVVAQTAIDKEVEVVILHKGEQKTLKVKVGRMDEGDTKTPPANTDEKKQNPTPSSKHSSLGMTLSAMKPELRTRFEIDAGVNGVVVTEVEPNSAAAEKDIQAGSIIVEVAQQKVTTPEELMGRLDELRKLKRKTALFLVSDGHGEMVYVAVSVE